MGLEKDRRQRRVLRLKGVDTWRGLTNVLSGTASITVSSNLVSSGSPPLVSMGATSVASHRPLVTTVDSIVDSVSFSIVVNNATVAAQQVVFVIVG